MINALSIKSTIMFLNSSTIKEVCDTLEII